MKVLVLGGTAEARQLAERIGRPAVLSLAGVTRANIPVSEYRQRVGGFGGAAGLADYLDAGGFSAVVDATHPFAARISHNIAAACTRLSLPLLRLERPAWPDDPAWHNVASLEMAARWLPPGARCFLTVGGHSLAWFVQRDDLWCLTRSIEPATTPPPNGQVILARPPFTLDQEIALMRRHKISHLVSKNAGGAATFAKLEAAAELGVQVVMVNRPRLPAVFTVASVAQALKWVENPGR